MAPWAGRTRHGRFTFEGTIHQLPVNAPPHAIHGTVRDRPWTVEEAGDHHAVLSCELGTDWPFDGWVVHKVSLGEAGLDLRLEVHAGEGPMPAECGWHPWLRRHRDGVAASVDLDAGAMYVRDSEGIPAGEVVAPSGPGPWDDCFTDVRRPTGLHWPDGMALAVESDCPYVVVYSEQAEAVCIEPQTGPPDALNHGPRVAVPGTPVVASATIRWAG
jgi:aldose 1-epimerase